jgi:hypothetical protein
MPIEMTKEQYESYLKEQQHQERVDGYVRSDISSKSMYPQVGKPITERQIEKLIDTDVPQNDVLKRLWLFSSESGRHFELTNIPDQKAHQKMKRGLRDIMRISTWDADEYMEIRQTLLLYNDVLSGKSIGWTDNARERDALNESRSIHRIEEGRQAPPRESSGFLSFMSGRRRYG